jgi:hypothetical protein
MRERKSMGQTWSERWTRLDRRLETRFWLLQAGMTGIIIAWREDHTFSGLRIFPSKARNVWSD